ncbi:MAG: excinuclease ABC subunit UvrA [Candidatus Niyogibacteria bacterium CG10_big_fil_rev_8_21_14_0_10_46_36]|uniref:UvrABC system protein A n=1 Tax=Candidatus Niyogibacteria bacterium CG10_big_fil_rev_8_21_14_0_10_46_36 TaxID=1974726 RepID=A0A2H0TCE6_9BACT|nr:MAG: excinuclease ABC subunit UvrA [Candidatus Niyogibacteria bacterium CG10_big_fil_rev_8_21_14_0_10_46_36]
MARKQPTHETDVIRIKGARTHNLKNISLEIPKNKLVVITGLSGSGKSSLAFDTIYAEAERRFVESLSSYARQFLGVREKPDVEKIEGLSPAIAIDQRSVSKNPRSTVGTITEIYDYLRILFARIGKPHCPACGRLVKKQTIDEMIKTVSREFKDTFVMIAAPVIRSKKGEHKKILAEIQKQGFLRVRLDGGVMRIEEALDLPLDPKKKHSIEVVVDRLSIDKDTERGRIHDSLETTLALTKGIALVVEYKEDANGTKGREVLFSENFSCPVCHISLPPIEPRLFSFNSPYGACERCTGLGHQLEVDPDLVMPNKKLTLAEGAIQPWARASHRVGRQSWYWWMIEDLSERYSFSLDTPVGALPKKVTDLILYGEKDTEDKKPGEAFEGVIPNLERRWRETDSEWTRAEIEKYMFMNSCPACGGKRLRPESLGVKIIQTSIAEVSAYAAEDAIAFMQKVLQEVKKKKQEDAIARPLVKEIERRLEFLVNVGLGYVSLDRQSTTLSGGEAQRVRLATQIGSGLSGVIYVLDEPSIGLHARDHYRLIQTLKELKALGNTVLVVEHDQKTMEEADWIIDLGEGAGIHGGKIIFEGTYSDIKKAKTLTGDYISGRKKVSVLASKENKAAGFITIKGAREHNLKNITVKIPLGKLVGVSGVSGSGKSTLINDILSRSLMQHFYGSRAVPGGHTSIEGLKSIDKVVVVDQSPIGRTPRSNPATYTGAFAGIRDLFSKTRDARARGYKAGRFSFNVKGGRCEECEGQGVKKIEMHFLPDIYVPCEECDGARYNREALGIHYNDKNIAEVLDMSVEEALIFFKNVPAIQSKIETLNQVGLSYIKLGQPATTLSGGEAQRVKLATELAKKATGRTVYILDEPTTGLHAEDVQKLLTVLRALVDKGNTVIVTEHSIDILRNADWLIDLGPEGGDGGGEIVVMGTPADVKKNKTSYTGKWL